MEPNPIQPIAPAPIAPTPTPSVCSVCHQPILPQYYFCPNCGAKINTAPLKTTAGAQVGLYAFSILLPIICYVFITRWQGMKYFKSHDVKTKRIGEISITLLVLSTLVTFWLAYFWTNEAIQSSITSINADMSGYQ